MEPKLKMNYLWIKYFCLLWRIGTNCKILGLEDFDEQRTYSAVTPVEIKENILFFPKVNQSGHNNSCKANDQN
jgi:hypothetical protein